MNGRPVHITTQSSRKPVFNETVEVVYSTPLLRALRAIIFDRGRSVRPTRVVAGLFKLISSQRTGLNGRHFPTGSPRTATWLSANHGTLQSPGQPIYSQIVSFTISATADQSKLTVENFIVVQKDTTGAVLS